MNFEHNGVSESVHTTSESKEEVLKAGVSDYFEYFSSSGDQASVEVRKLDSEQELLSIDKVNEGPQKYVRFLWPCKDLQAAVQGLDSSDFVEASFQFPGLQAFGNDIAWIALLQGDPTGGAKFYHKIWESKPGKKLDSTELYTLVLEGGSASSEINLCFHFDSIDGCSLLPVPQIKFETLQSLKVEKAVYKDFELSVTGVVRDDKNPGMPVKLQLLVNGLLKGEVWARSRAPYSNGAMLTGLYSFKFSCKQSNLVPIDDITIFIPVTGKRSSVNLTEVDEKTIETLVPQGSIDEKSEIIGNVESFTRNRVQGWAVCKQLPTTPIDLLLRINDVPFAHFRTSISRPDVDLVVGTESFAGFSFELPAGLALADDVDLSISPLVGQNKIKKNKFSLGPLGPNLIKSAIVVERKLRLKRVLNSNVKASAIVLNQNGGDLLAEMFDSAYRYEDIESIEWIIVDHQSYDHSLEVCKAAIERGQQIKFIARNGNFSFSESNNFGVEAASYDHLLFLNNDLVFNGPFVNQVISTLNDKSVGIVGASLTDHISKPTQWATQAPVQHLGVYFNTQLQGPWIRAYEARNTLECASHYGNIVPTPVTTGAFIGMRRSDFEEVGGFDTAFYYGLEDIDLCLKTHFQLGKTVVTDNSLKIAHHRGFSRSKEGDTTVRRRNNNNLLNTRWGNQLRYSAKSDVFRNVGFWTGSKPVIGFAVVDAGDDTSAGEYYTALELARALQEIHPVHIRFLTESEWTDLTEIDVLIVMVNKFDLHKVRKASPFLITINWTRQWFDRWAQDDTIYSYDFVFASSQRAASYLQEKTGISVDVLPIATDYERFQSGAFDAELAADYCLTGNKVGTTREIELQLDPASINGKGAIFGSNWENTPLESISRGPISYSKIHNVYASSKIAVDDANIATKDFGSCNSRVFDSIAGGSLLLTNGKLGVEELFGELVPTYSSQEELTSQLNYWISHSSERNERVKKLQEIVKEKHTYANRASVISCKLLNNSIKPRISIKCAAPYAERSLWGDTHFAQSLARALRLEGFTVRVDYRESWNNGLADSDDAVIMLRGIVGYKPKPHQFSILWLISHPNDVPVSELDNFDQIFVASRPHTEILRELTEVPTDVLLQCTDVNLFRYNQDLKIGNEPTLFVGNSRGIFRQALKWSIELEVEVDIYGSGWGQFVTDGRLKGQYIPNELLPEYYQSSSCVLCDHWDDMKRLGYLSNRAFDVLAVGGWLVVDHVNGIEDILDGGYEVFNSKEELRDILSSGRSVNVEDRLKRAQWVTEHHSFNARAKTLATCLRSGLKEKINVIVESNTGSADITLAN